MKSSGLDAPRLEPRWDPPGERFERWEWGTAAYPEPLVDLAAEAAEAKERFRAASR